MERLSVGNTNQLDTLEYRAVYHLLARFFN